MERHLRMDAPCGALRGARRPRPQVSSLPATSAAGSELRSPSCSQGVNGFSQRKAAEAAEVAVARNQRRVVHDRKSGEVRVRGRVPCRPRLAKGTSDKSFLWSRRGRACPVPCWTPFDGVQHGTGQARPLREKAIYDLDGEAPSYHSPLGGSRKNRRFFGGGLHPWTCAEVPKRSRTMLRMTLLHLHM